MEDDKRFMRDDNNKSKEEKEEEKKKIPIELPDIEPPLKKTPQPEEKPKEESKPPQAPEQPPESEKTEQPPKPEKLETKKKSPLQRLTLEELKKIKGLKDIGSKIPKIDKEQFSKFFESIPHMPPIFIIYILSALLSISFLLNIFFSINIAGLKKRLESNTKVVEDVISSKQTVENEKTALREEIERLKRDAVITKNKSEGLNRQNEILKEELNRSKAAYSKLESELGGYAEEVKELATRRIKYYDAYKSEKENSSKLNLIIKELQNEIDTLKDQMGSISGKYKDREAAHIYDMAFLYIKASMFDDALKSFERYMELAGEDADMHFNMGYIYEHAKADRRSAIAHYKKYLALKPNAEDIYEIKMKIASLERAGKKRYNEQFKAFKINLDKLKY